MYKVEYLSGDKVKEVIVNTEDIDMEGELNSYEEAKYLSFKKEDGKIIYIKEDTIISIEEL